MKFLLPWILILLMPSLTAAQNPLYIQPTKEQIVNWLNELPHVTNDTLRMAMCRDLCFYYMEFNRDSSQYFGAQQLILAKELKLKLWEADGYEQTGYLQQQLGNYTKSLQALLAGLKIVEDEKIEQNIWRIAKFSNDGDSHFARLNVSGNIHLDLGQLYFITGNREKARSTYFETIKIAEEINDATLLAWVHMDIGTFYLDQGQLDSALISEQKALEYTRIGGNKKYMGNGLAAIGKILLLQGNYPLAKQNLISAIQVNLEQNNQQNLSDAFLTLSDYFRINGQSDSSLFYAKKGLSIVRNISSQEGLLTAYSLLTSLYKLSDNIDSAFLYQELAMSVRDSLRSTEKNILFQNIGFDEMLKVQELETEKIMNQNKIRIYMLLTGIAAFMLIAFLLYRNNRNRKKANELLLKQKEEIAEQKHTVEQALETLKSTQAQLIQSEKMASLGELTAGIAHEIQNPLNFVNNFAEVSKELVEEVKAERLKVKGERDEKLEKEILEDIDQNLKKIHHHGQRASGIVKGMLEHSRARDGKKEPTDINALADEYLRLAYHGLRAKDKSFNADFKTDLNPSLPKINVVPQDIGRVLLNLINNAFYAVDKKAKSGVEVYKPEVIVTTKLWEEKVMISVKDNGLGIPSEIKDKIFQPFFTTKPTGSGIGLGLSLSYDIIKAHGGELKVKSQEGEGSEFIILLQFNK